MIVGIRSERVGTEDAVPKIVLVGNEAKAPLAEVCGLGVDLYRIEFANPRAALAARFPDGIKEVASSGHGIENMFRALCHRKVGKQATHLCSGVELSEGLSATSRESLLEGA